MKSLNWLYILLWNLFVTIELGSTVDVMEHSTWKLFDDDFCGESNTDRIVGGTNANLGAYPWIARIGYNRSYHGKKKVSFKCGGSLITEFYVITAAHCVTNLPHGWTVARVRLGEHNTLTDPDCEHGYCADPVQDFQLASIIFHKHFNPPLLRHDIALIRLDRPAKINEFVMPICMLKGPLLRKSFIGESAEVAGWGIYDIRNPEDSTILQTLKVPITDRRECDIFFNSTERTERIHICAGGVLGKDSCGGDSGGPLMTVQALDGPPKYYLLGIVSFGVEECGDLPTPGVYTSIPSYVAWILDNVSP